MSISERLNEVSSLGGEERGSPKIGANQAKRQIAFFPGGEVDGEVVETGDGTAIEYHCLLFEQFARDWTRIVITFTTHIVEVEGRGLKGLLHQLKAHVVDEVGMSDALSRLDSTPRFDVTGVRVTVRTS